MLNIKKNIALLGSTGSIGTQVLDIVKNKPDLFNVFLLSANSNYKLLYKQILTFKPKYAVINSKAGYLFLKKNISNQTTCVHFGVDDLSKLVQDVDINLVVTAIVGSAGLVPTVSAIKAKKNIALANKETLVVAGELIMDLATKNNVSILPIDSEHSAIFQCLVGEVHRSIKNLTLTASGGPFLNLPHKDFKHITVKKALKHPNWDMGAKITIDSATLMNKGLEVIEAKWLFNVSHKDIRVIIHPESIIHSLVEFFDGSTKAQLGLPTMTIPILYALCYPDRTKYHSAPFDLSNIGKLHFLKPNHIKFPHLKIAYNALETGGNAPCVMNASNEIVVEAFLNKKIKFTDMFKMIEKSLENSIFVAKPTLDDYLMIDQETREKTKLLIK
jgi:1-deoxy-D-xylulose-5-phosphate reductoisomerase